MLLAVAWKNRTKIDLPLTCRIQGISSQDCFWEGFENLQQVAAGVGNVRAASSPQRTSGTGPFDVADCLGGLSVVVTSLKSPLLVA
jgi:hypothetical protein